ncbi:poly-beta-1,6-N-acetyl-D-glucosamine biosynthesis protein PgaD [Variovorax sp. HJSM1_2]|uniref:poly-beta-1,6-N-acetyl-D-glucosamine biosynthesis protein PgaD n=1 Tax=Variovorax sp. HJSM1_2 TaxID=3366263 RepID=UPI003BDCC605
MSTLIIERPDLQDWQRKTVFSILTAAFWLAWILLWMPLITLAGWFFFGVQFNLQMFELHGATRFLNVLLLYLAVIVCLGGSLTLWALYNHYRFKGVDRRKETAAPTPNDLAQWTNHHAEKIGVWRELSNLTVHHDAKGRIERVTHAIPPLA